MGNAGVELGGKELVHVGGIKVSVGTGGAAEDGLTRILAVPTADVAIPLPFESVGCTMVPMCYV